MPRLSDRDRILRLLSDSEGLSNLRVKTELGLADERYEKVRGELIQEGLVEKIRGRGGGVRLTRKGEKEILDIDEPTSTVGREADLYEPLRKFLEKQASEDSVKSVICETHNLKVRGKWQNPDVTRISIEHHRNLRKTRVAVTTYEVKQFWRWDTGTVFEAASHHRFSHESWVVLEWPNGAEFSLTDPTYKIDQIQRECQRFGVGLATFHPFYNSYRLRPRLDPRPSIPDDQDVEAWLDYVFSRNAEARKKYNQQIDDVDEAFNEPATDGEE
jgi:hypothetical protein